MTDAMQRRGGGALDHRTASFRLAPLPQEIAPLPDQGRDWASIWPLLAGDATELR